MRRKHIIGLTTLCTIIICVLVMTNFPKETKSELEINTSNPTVFVHGYKGTHNSFGSMLGRFEEEYKWGNKAIVYRISKQGDLRRYNLNKGKREPAFIQVIFEDNRANFIDTTQWLSKVMNDLRVAYHIDTVNLVGHSMGGIVALKYLEEYQHSERFPMMDKLITIGSPFDGIYSETYFQLNRDPATIDLRQDSSALQLLQKNKQSIPNRLRVLNIGSTGDLVATPQSVQALRTIIPSDQLEEVMIKNDDLGHSELHENKEVDYLIHKFLWQDDVQ
ncbi:alpha/beta fold hydrolase [Virgibacillus byunsanensis]|uniref:Alpha/beta fold hydrolase n=1 Tax=Virgibacillus byunsanensis TaxID=570945 RepID=A0ABW3LIS9_9BACI